MEERGKQRISGVAVCVVGERGVWLRRGSGFTLIELLVALAILSLLMALLIPAMARAREAARLAGCMSNLHQISVATYAYSDENAGGLPFPEPRTLQFFDNYGFGGRFTTSEASEMLGIRLPQNRPLNRFMFPKTFKSGMAYSKRALHDVNAYNLPVFECPSDDAFNYTEHSREGRAEPTYTQSGYYTTGTSYAFNATWMGNEKFFQYGDVAVPLEWVDGIRMFERSRFAYPSRFVSYIDEPGNFQSVVRKRPQETHHTGENSYSTAFMDGHAGLVSINRNRPFSRKHTLIFLEQQRR